MPSILLFWLALFDFKLMERYMLISMKKNQ